MIVTCFSRLLSRKPKKPPLRVLVAAIGTAAPGKADKTIFPIIEAFRLQSDIIGGRPSRMAI
jgi:uncharacterized membrane protein YjjB (DUF3815 family)